MTNHLYFISMIADALRKADPKAALMVAIEEIKILGRQPQHKRGFLQFERFMTEVRKCWEKHHQKPEEFTADMIRWVALQMVGGLLEEEEKKAVLDVIGSQPRWKDEFEELCREISKFEPVQTIPAIVVERDREFIASIRCELLPVAYEIGNVKPGYYTIRLDTGRILWQGELKEQDLIWPIAFPEQDLDLAADTGDFAGRTTQEITLLNGFLILRVFPETDSGRLELKIAGSNVG